MADLTANVTTQVVKPFDTASVEVVNTEVLYQGAFLGFNTVNNGTSADIGRVEPFDNSAEQVLLGVFAGPAEAPSDGTLPATVTGATGLTPPVRTRIATKERYIEGTVAGATARTVMGQLVYVTTDNPADMTLTRPTYGGNPVGFVLEWITGTTCRVYVFSFAERLLYAMGGGAETLQMGAYSPAGVTASGTVLSLTAPFHGRIIQMRSSTGRAWSSGAHTLIARIGTTNVTGGTVALSAPAFGATSTGSVTNDANNRFHEGDLLVIRVGGAITQNTSSPGWTNVSLYCERLAGA